MSRRPEGGGGAGSELESLRARLAESEERLRFLTETTGVAFYRLRYADMRYEYLSPAIERLTGYSPEQIQKIGFKSLVLSITAPAAEELDPAELAERRRRGQTGEYRADYLIRTRGGGKRWLADHSSPWLDDAGREIGSAGVLSDITERKRLEESLRYLATTDHLTGAFNRRHFLDLSQRELVRARRYGIGLSLAIMDLDHFKAVNDRLGHAAGDAVLAGLAGRVWGGLRENDVFGRLGGEEFGVTLVECSPSQALAVAERLRAAVAGRPFDAAGAELTVTVSLGLASLAGAEEELEALMQRADTALYAAKEAGRDRVRSAR